MSKTGRENSACPSCSNRNPCLCHATHLAPNQSLQLDRPKRQTIYLGQLSREKEDPFDKLVGNNSWKGVRGPGNKEYAVCESGLHV